MSEFIEDKVYAAIGKELEAGKAPHLEDLKNKWGNKEVNRVVRELTKKGFAGVHRRRLHRVDGVVYFYESGTVTQRGPGRFIFKNEAGQESFMTGKSSRLVLDGDRLKCFVSREGGDDSEAIPVEVVERNLQKLHVARAKYSGGGLSFYLDNRVEEIKVLLDFQGFVAGDVWFCRVQETGLLRDEVRAVSVSKIGNEADKGIESALAYQTRFGAETRSQDSVWPVEIGLESSIDAKARRDIRKLPLVTIDGESSRDFDDAIAVIPEDHANGWRLVVAIADVSAFIGNGTELSQKLDDFAKKKMTSVYLPHEVIPMLPTVVSNGVCSLNLGVDRYVLCCEMKVSSSGEIVSFDFFRGVMQSHARLTYNEVQKFLDGSHDFIDSDVRANVSALNDLSVALRGNGVAQGRLDMGEDEVAYKLNSDGKIEAITSTPRLWSHKLVEECMLAANRCAARFLSTTIGFGMFRNHLGVKAGDIHAVHQTFEAMGLKIGDGLSEITQSQISDVLTEAKALGKYSQARSAILSSMSSANYEAKNLGHFSLVAPYYCHFTSPIRRYPDLLVHQLIKSGIDQAPAPYTEPELVALAEESSKFSQKASQAENEAKKLLLLNYMQRHAGSEFDSVVSSIGERGLWVGLPIGGAKLEFFLPGKPLRDGGYKWQEVGQTWCGPDSVLLVEGCSLKCRIDSIDLIARRLDLKPVSTLQAVINPEQGGVKGRLSI